MTAIVQIEGREAIPVRAIPFITGWGLSPLDVANHFARIDSAPFGFFDDVFTYHIQADSPVKMLPKEWDAVRADLLALEAKTKAKHEDESIGYAAWRKDSVGLLPAAVFVFKDEFEKGWARKFQIAEYQEQREGEHALNYSPLFPAGMLEVVMGGFGVSEQKNWRDLLKEKRVVSKAPPPITPVRGRASPMKQLRAQKQNAPDWSFWRLKAYVKDWAAAALSIGIDPDSLKHNPNAWMSGTGKTSFLGQSFINDEQERQFDKRYRLAMEWGQEHGDKVKYFNTGEIELKGFAAWAVENELPVPGEFANLFDAGQSVFKLGTTTKPASNLDLDYVERKDLIEGFKVETDEGENKRWWENRFKSLSRNTPRGLADAIEDKKIGKTGSHLFNPAAVACWLLEEGKLTEKELLRAIRQNPKFAPFIDQFMLCVKDDAGA